MVDNSYALREVKNRVKFLKANSDLAKVVVGEGTVNGKKYDFFPNGFGLMAWLFNEQYSEVGYKDGSRSHAFPGINGPGLFSYVGFENMLNSRFYVNENNVRRWDIVTIGEFVQEFAGSEKEAERESEGDAFRRTQIVDVGLSLGGSGTLSSVDVFGIDSYKNKFVNATWNAFMLPPGCELFYHTLKQ